MYWVNQNFYESLRTEKWVNKQIELVKIRHEKRKNRGKHLKRKHENRVNFTLKNLSKECKLHLKKAKKLIKQDIKYSKGQWQLYNNTFKDNKLSKLDFIELLELI